MAVSLTLFSITATVFIISLTAGLRITELAVEESDAATVATSQVENTLGQAYAEPPNYPTVTSTGGLSISFDNFVLDPTLLQRITVTVSDEDATILELTTYKTNETFIASPPALQFAQRDFRWYENTGDLTPTTTLATESTPFTLRELGQVFRLRMSVQLPDLPLSTGDQSFKLQYATGVIGPWTDVGPAGGPETWRGFDNATIADGATLPTTVLSLSNVGETYEEANPSAVNPNAVASNNFAEWDWVLEENGAPFNTTFFFRMVKGDDTALESYTRYPSIIMPPPLTLTQTDYRWFENVDSLDPSTPLAFEHTPFSATTHGEVYRLRMSVGVDGLNLSTGSQAFKLQFSTDTGGPWTDVGSTVSATTWRFFDNPSVANGTTVGSLLLSTSNVRETYQEANPSVANPNPINVNQRGEWDWVVQDNGAADNTTFFFRMVESDDTALGVYTFYPQITTPPAPVLTQIDYQWFDNLDGITPTTDLADANTPFTGATPLGVFRLRMNVAATVSNLTASDQAFKLQFATSTGGSYTDVGPFSSTGDWRFFNNASVTDGTTLPSTLISTSDVPESYEEINPSAANPNAIDIGERGEWDWVVQSNTSTPATFFFRMVKDDDSPLDGYTNFPEITTIVSTLTQLDYRWFANVDNADPITSLAAENSPATGATPLSVFRLRMNVDVSGIDLTASIQAFKLQYSTSTGGSWTDLGIVNSSAAWRGFDNAGTPDGLTIGALLLSTSDVLESYEEANPSVSNPNGILAGQQGE